MPPSLFSTTSALSALWLDPEAAGPSESAAMLMNIHPVPDTIFPSNNLFLVQGYLSKANKNASTIRPAVIIIPPQEVLFNFPKAPIITTDAPIPISKFFTYLNVGDLKKLIVQNF
jgi:hypothetical protein